MIILRLFKRLIIFTGLLGLCLLLSGTVFYLVYREEHTGWIPGDAQLLVELPAIRCLADPTNRRLLLGVLPPVAGLPVLLQEIKLFQKIDRQLLKQVLPVSEAPALLWLNKRNRLSIVIDTGWRSLLYSGGLFAVRSVFSDGDRYRFSHTEKQYNGETFLLYRISILDRGIELYLAKFGNLLLLSQTERELLHALRSHEQKKSLAKHPRFLTPGDPVENGKIRVIHPPTGARRLLQKLLPQKYRKLTALLPLQTVEYELKRTTDGNLHLTGRVRFAEESGDRQAYRLLNSNRYRPRILKQLPGNTQSGLLLCADDIQELHRLSRPVFFSGTNRTAGKNKDGYVWNGTELGRFTQTGNGAPFFYLRALHPLRAEKQLKKNSGKQPLLLKELADALQLPELASAYYRQGRYFFFHKSRKVLQSLLVRPADKRGVKTPLNRLKCNLFYFWSGGQGAERPGRVSPLFRTEEGVISARVADDRLEFQAIFGKKIIR